MKIENYQDFVNLVSLLPKLREFPIIQVIMNLRSVLNRGCKCNKKKKEKQLEVAYNNALTKYKENDFFNEIIKDYMSRLDITDIEFSSEKQIIFSLKYE